MGDFTELAAECWSRPGTGKPGSVRVIYFNLTEEEVVLLVAV
jgi:hypothetical protein